MSFLPRPHEIYKHFKGNLYQIVTIAQHSETGEQMVVYQALYGEFKTYVRPLAMFVSEVDHARYPDVTQRFRFELQGKEQERQCVEPSLISDKEEASPMKEEAELDPLVLEFLDADTYGQRLNILSSLHHRITNDMITIMAVACDIEVNEGDPEERYEALRNCLLTLERFECNRLR